MAACHAASTVSRSLRAVSLRASFITRSSSGIVRSPIHSEAKSKSAVATWDRDRYDARAALAERVPSSWTAASSRRRTSAVSLSFSRAMISAEKAFAGRGLGGAVRSPLGRGPDTAFRVLVAERVQPALDPLQLDEDLLLGGQDSQQVGHAAAADQVELPPPHRREVLQATVLLADQVAEVCRFPTRSSVTRCDYAPHECGG